MLKRRGAREIGGLLILFVLMIAIAVFYEQVGQERVAADAPTTVSTKGVGVRGLMLLLRSEGIRADPLTAPWSDLSSHDGLLVYVEPADTDRLPSADDIKVLETWVRRGGTLLDLVSEPPVDQPLNPADPFGGDCGAKAGPSDLHDVAVNQNSGSPLLAGVQKLSVRSGQRLTLATGAPYTILAQDTGGIVAVEKHVGEGRLISVANRYGATNAGLAEADNALFMVNIARETAVAKHRVVRFDEYHHGMGFQERTVAREGNVWTSIPLPWRFAMIYLLGAALILVYNGNRRFGPARVITPVALRASTDYVNSMARLYRRAGASDIAIEILYARFLRDLKRAMDLPNEASVAVTATAAEQRFGAAANGLRNVIGFGEAVIAGKRLSEPDMLNLAQQMEHFRRAFQLVGV